MRLKDKVVLITGASSGIGKYVALLFAKEGAKVVAGARRTTNLEELRQTAKEQEFAGEILPVTIDISDEDALQNFVDVAVETYGKIDVLVNNAGIMDDYQSLQNVDDDMWYRVFEVNVHAVMKLSRIVIKYFLEQGYGNIINTTSVGGLHGMRGGLAYVSSKHAIVGMTKNIAFTYHDKNIRANAVAPGSIATEIGTTVKNPDMISLEKLMKGYDAFPILGYPEDIANSYLYLASDESKFTNGHILVVDGGWTAY